MANQIFRGGWNQGLKNHKEDVCENDEEVISKFDILVPRKPKTATFAVVCPPTTQSFDHYNINVIMLN